jgi:hypothetical protein
MGLFQSFMVYGITAQKPGVPIELPICFIWFSLVIIGFFNDVDYWRTHMFGVVSLVLSVFWKIHQEKRSYSLLFIAMVFYMTRFVIKAHALLFLEQLPVNELWKANFDIMISSHPRTLLVFQFSGVFQWIALGIKNSGGPKLI